MATKNQAPAPAADEETIAQAEAQSISNWEFINRTPTRDEVMELLAGHWCPWGLDYTMFADYVQALPQNKKIKRKDPDNPRVYLDTYVESWTLYVSVAGRVAMLNHLQNEKKWRVDHVPERKTPTGIPGYIEAGERIVYREYLSITAEGKQLGSKPGTAWVPRSGGQAATGSNPYEKVETSARGRAIAAWGIGVLPGSGIASVEEIQAVLDAKAAMNAEANASGGGRRQQRMSRDDLISKAKTVAEEVRIAESMDEDAMEARIGNYLREKLGLERAYDRQADGTLTVDWTVPKDGQLQLLINVMTDRLKQLKSEEELG